MEEMTDCVSLVLLGALCWFDQETLCDYAVEEWEETQEGGDVCILLADTHRCLEETNTTW